MPVKIRKVELKNCFQHRSLEAEFGDFQIIVGPNGSGKSNLVESMLYGLGLKFGLPGTKDTMVTHGQETGSVNLTLEHEGQLVDVRASMGSSNRRLKREGVDIRTMQEVLDYLQNVLLRTPFDIVTQSSVVRQNDLVAGLFDPPARRMDAFLRMAGLRDIEAKRKQLSDEKDRHVIPMLSLNIDEVKHRIAEMEASQTEISARCDGLRKQYEPALYKDCQTLILKAEQALAKVDRIKELVASVTRLQNEVGPLQLSASSAKIQVDKTTLHLDQVKALLPDANKAIQEYQTMLDKLNSFAALDKKIKDVQAVLSTNDSLNPGEWKGGDGQELRALVAELEANLKMTSESLATLNKSISSARCPTCRKPLSAEEVERLKTQYTMEIQEFKQLAAQAATDLRAFRIKFDEHQAAKGNYERTNSEMTARLHALQEQLVQYEGLKDIAKPEGAYEVLKAVDQLGQQLRIAVNQMTSVNAQLAAKSQELAVSQNELDTLNQAALEVDEKAVVEAEAFVKKQQELNDEIFKLSGQLKELDSQLVKAKAQQDDLLDKQKKIETLQRYVNFLEFARGALHRDNFPSGKVAAFVDRMLSQTNAYLDVMRAGFSVFYENETGFMAVFPSDNKTIRADRLSWGQKIVFALAFRFSVNELRSDTGFLILDEPTVFLDDLHVERVVEALNLVKSKLVPRVQVIVVTHDERLMAVGDKVLELGK